MELLLKSQPPQTEQQQRVSFSSIEEAVEHSNFSKRIKFLLVNPELGYQTFVARSKGYDEPSNCFGTSVFITGDYRPGYVDNPHMKWFLENRCAQSQTPVSDSIIALNINNRDSEGFIERIVFHTGIFIGEINGTPYYVGQNGCGGIFRARELIKHPDVRVLGYFQPFKSHPEK